MFSQLIAVILLIVPLLLLTALILHQQRQIALRQLKGLRLVTRLKQLISLSQRHRGLVSGWLAGDAGLMSSISLLQQEIERQQQQLAEPMLNANERWQGYLQHWQRLTKQLRQLSVEHSFNQHTQLVANLLFLLEDIAEQHRLTPTALRDFQGIGLLWRELLLAAEAIGQARAVGSAMLTGNQFSGVDKIRLGFLRQKIMDTTEPVLLELPKSGVLLQNPSLLQEAADCGGALTDFIGRQLLAEVPLMTPAEYFRLATTALDTYHRIFDTQVEHLSHLIQHSKNLGQPLVASSLAL